MQQHSGITGWAQVALELMLLLCGRKLFWALVYLLGFLATVQISARLTRG